MKTSLSFLSNPHKHFVIHDSPADFARATASVRGRRVPLTVTQHDADKPGYWEGRGRHSWSGEDFDDSLRLSIQGALGVVPKAQSIVDLVDAEVEVPGRVRRKSVAGGCVNVADFLAGEPECFSRWTIDSDSSTPVTIAYTTTSSGGINADVLIRRGTAVLALALKLSAIRPVNIVLVTALHSRAMEHGNSIICLPSNPMNLSEVAYAIASPGFDRNLTHEYHRQTSGFNGGWAKWANYGSTPEEVEARFRMLAGVEGDLLYIPPAYLNDDEIAADPVAWVNKCVARFSKQLSE